MRVIRVTLDKLPIVLPEMNQTQRYALPSNFSGDVGHVWAGI